MTAVTSIHTSVHPACSVGSCRYTVCWCVCVKRWWWQELPKRVVSFMFRVCWVWVVVITIFEKMTVALLVNIFTFFIELGYLLPCLQDLPLEELKQLNLVCTHKHMSVRIYFNTVLLFTPRSHKWLFSWDFYWNCVLISSHPMHCTCLVYHFILGMFTLVTAPL